jgi:NAD(P)-dependent dehydrogenase (short-subunit alcohol dehydrogenase family)
VKSFRERFTGRAAIITGGASGVGFDTAKHLVAEGGSVALWDRDAQVLARARRARRRRSL